MSLLVQKYGGSSLGNLEKLRNVAKKVKSFRDEGHDLIVVVSAMAGETDRLVDMAHKLSAIPAARELDVVLSTGEQVSIGLLAIALQDLGCEAVSYTGGQVKIYTDSAHNKARIIGIEEANIRRDLQAGRVVIVAGFQGVDEKGAVTTLGRGGSDTSAVAIAAAMKADECQIYTDVDGVYTADPNIVVDARRMPEVTFEEMLELSSLGAKVLQIRAVECAGKHNVPICVASTFLTKSEGTLINYEQPNMEQRVVSGVAYNRNEACIMLKGVPNNPSIPYKIFQPLSDSNIEIDVIVQNVVNDESTDISFTVNRDDSAEAMSLIAPLADELHIREVKINDTVAKVSVVGVGMSFHAGIAAKLFKVLGDLKVDIHLVSTSEVKVSVVIDEKYIEEGVRSLHKAFNLHQER